MILISFRLRCNVSSIFRCLQSNSTSFLISVSSRSGQYTNFFNGLWGKDDAFSCLRSTTKEEVGVFNEGHLGKISGSRVKDHVLCVNGGLFRQNFANCRRVIVFQIQGTCNPGFRLTNAFFAECMRSSFINGPRCHLRCRDQFSSTQFSSGRNR